ncbi:unnamed protein product [Phytophthora fragariaefolia]|uniref:Unnamed protein product n=1 Tax=Phytophthora fragariaefolia TaxID=1490495 RepID=A0A9W6XN25_9STRA|nr:unnamed protein product [Phytophthora fragariaefolia]
MSSVKNVDNGVTAPRTAGDFHERRCQDWKAFQEVKKLVRQAVLSDLPNHVREAILNGATPNGEVDSEVAQFNH